MFQSRRAFLARLADLCGPDVINLLERQDFERRLQHLHHPVVAYNRCAYRLQNIWCLMSKIRNSLQSNRIDSRNFDLPDLLVEEAEEFVKDVRRLKSQIRDA